MIRFRDALLLAGTKLKTRKLRTIVTATLSSLLFVIIVFAFSVASGMINSYQRFSANSLSERYLASVTFFDSFGIDGVDYSSKELIGKAQSRQAELVRQKIAEAARLDIDYSPEQEPSIFIGEQYEDEPYLNQDHPAVEQVVAEHMADRPSATERVAELAAPYQPKARYNHQPFDYASGLKIMTNGREGFSTENQPRGGIVLDSDITTMGYLPNAVTEPYILPGADISRAEKRGDAIAVVVPYSAAEKALDYEPLARTATNDEKLRRLDSVKQKAVNVLIEACYRNSASQYLLEQAKQQIKDSERSAGSPNYQAPAVQYGLPAETSCGAVPITADARSAEERAYEERLSEFRVKFGEEVRPEQAKLTFRIVGLAPDYPDFSEISTAQSLVMMLSGTSLQGQWAVPSELVGQDLRRELASETSQSTNLPFMGNFDLVEFSTPEAVKQFVNEVGCSRGTCENQPYIQYFGSNSVLIDDIMNQVFSVLKWVVLVMVIIAAILMGGMAGRVISDSRRETAVFRAIGAQRNDIRLVYVLYIVMFSLIVALVAVALGLLGAWLLSISQQEAMTVAARLMFIESNETGPYRAVGVWPVAIAATMGVIVLTGLISILLPLARNLVRSPLKDMRSE